MESIVSAFPRPIRSVDTSLPAPSVSERFVAMRREREREERSHEAENNLLASWHDLNEPFTHSWERAGNRLREERLMGLHPPRKTVSASTLRHFTGDVMELARRGNHVAITNHGERAAVMVDAAEYDRLKVDARLLTFEDVRDVAPDDWGRG